MISQEELTRLLQEEESARVEKTTATNATDKFGEAICAFANDFPDHKAFGYLIIGFDDKEKKTTGLQVTDQLLQNIAAIKTDGNLIPPIALSVEKFKFPGGDLAVVEVHPHHQPPVRYKNKIWIRTGSRKGVANEAEERILSEKRSSLERNFETQPCDGSSLNDLDVSVFSFYLPHAIDRETLEQNHRDIKEQMASLKFFDLKKDIPTNVGIIMFAKNSRHFIPGNYIQYVRFKGETLADEVDFAKEFSGDLPTLLKNLDDFIKYQIIKEKLEPISTLRERRIENYPHWALRELLLNAIIHRDYKSSSAPIKFYEYIDRIEIMNPGGLYGNVRPEYFPQINDYRNPELASVAKNLGYVNKFNSGIERAKHILQKNGNPDPKFIIDNPFQFSVTIFIRDEDNIIGLYLNL